LDSPWLLAEICIIKSFITTKKEIVMLHLNANKPTVAIIGIGNIG
jgi:hypothetical protein